MIISVACGKANSYIEVDGAPSPDTIDMLLTKAATTALSVYKTKEHLHGRSTKQQPVPTEED